MPTTNRTSTSFVQSILIRQCSQRDYSAQEYIWILLGFPFYHSSRSFVTLNLQRDTYVPIDNENDQTNDISCDFEKLYGKRLLNFQISARRGNLSNGDQFYEQRLQIEKQNVENLSMFNFFQTYYKRNRNTLVWSKYNKSPIVRIFPSIKPPTVLHNDNLFYYELQVKLHVPWQNDFQTYLNLGNISWLQIYKQYRNQIPNYIDLDQLEEKNNNEDFEEEQIMNQTDMNLHEWMIYMRMRPGQEQTQAELGFREQDNIDWTTTFNNYENSYQLRNFISNYAKQMNENIQNDIQMPEVVFSEEQQKVLNVVYAQIQFLRIGI